MQVEYNQSENDYVIKVKSLELLFLCEALKDKLGTSWIGGSEEIIGEVMWEKLVDEYRKRN